MSQIRLCECGSVRSIVTNVNDAHAKEIIETFISEFNKKDTKKEELDYSILSYNHLKDNKSFQKLSSNNKKLILKEVPKNQKYKFQCSTCKKEDLIEDNTCLFFDGQKEEEKIPDLKRYMYDNTLPILTSFKCQKDCDSAEAKKLRIDTKNTIKVYHICIKCGFTKLLS